MEVLFNPFEEKFNLPAVTVDDAYFLGYPELPEYRLPSYLADPNDKYPYVLITGARQLIYYHGRNRNYPRFRQAIPGPEIEIHPLDAEK